jgi:hypothetical protein
MKYTMRGYLFDKQTKEPLPILPGIIVSGYDEALKLIKNTGYEHYLFTLDRIQEEE